MEKKKKVGFASEVVGVKKNRRVVFDIKCEAQDENHAVKVLINNHLKYQDKIIRANEITTLTVSIGLTYLGLDNSLTLIDQTDNNTGLLVYEVRISVFEEKEEFDETGIPYPEKKHEHAPSEEDHISETPKNDGKNDSFQI